MNEEQKASEGVEWFPRRASGGQGMVTDERTGKPIAVIYNPDDAGLIAAAPKLLEQLRRAENALRHAVQEARGRVNKEFVGGWLYHANEARAVMQEYGLRDE